MKIANKKDKATVKGTDGQLIWHLTPSL